MEFFHKRYEKSVYGDEPASSGQERALTAYALDSTNHNTSCRDNDMAEFGAAKKLSKTESKSNEFMNLLARSQNTNCDLLHKMISL